MYPQSTSFTPAPLAERLTRRLARWSPSLAAWALRMTGSRGLANFTWLIADRCVRMLVTVFVGSWVARYLGAEQFGQLNYVLTWASIATVVSSLGMDAIVVRLLIDDPGKHTPFLKTVVLIRSLCSVVLGVAVVGMLLVLRGGQQTPLYAALVLLGVMFQSLESYELWFQSQLRIGLLVVPRLGLFVVVNALKCFLVFSGSGLGAFFVISCAELALGGALTFRLFRRHAIGAAGGRADYAWAKQVLAESWPLAIAALAVVLYMRINQLLLADLLDDAALGVYAAALRIAEAPYFLPMTLATSILPYLQRGGEGSESYPARRLRYFRISAALGYAFSGGFILFSGLFIDALYGAKYHSAIPVMRILSGAIFFVCMGVARAQCLVTESLSMMSLRFTLWGLAFNIAFGLAFIPAFGVEGAAWAVLLGQALSSLFSSFFYRSTRALGVEQLKAALTPWKI